MLSTTDLEEQEIVDAPGNDGNASMPEQVNRPNPWRKMMMIVYRMEEQNAKQTEKKMEDVKKVDFRNYKVDWGIDVYRQRLPQELRTATDKQTKITN